MEDRRVSRCAVAEWFGGGAKGFRGSAERGSGGQRRLRQAAAKAWAAQRSLPLIAMVFLGKYGNFGLSTDIVWARRTIRCPKSVGQILSDKI